eukprot:CAMPEP_0183744962 /NCGR_PEP_ID=MMETSP0737-20130205/65999_1 /TAXON_ID=385413 /ORGANISM="Thalassiosira miniscula, Strain CCMP1093" /LENGTH=601 /DNA_ID=CAMNT_0025980617 /DNA_START=23 /DNA_END=1829 /DNA_ORIENTATION=+
MKPFTSSIFISHKTRRRRSPSSLSISIVIALLLISFTYGIILYITSSLLPRSDDHYYYFDDGILPLGYHTTFFQQRRSRRRQHSKSTTILGKKTKQQQHDQQQQRRVHVKRAESPPPGTCGQVYLWGGGKSGSTTVWYTLAWGPGGSSHQNYDAGPFLSQHLMEDLDIGKEGCRPKRDRWERWAELTRNETICSRRINHPPRNNNDGSNNDNNDNSLLLLQRTHVMNGCPRHTSVEDAKAIMNVEGGPGYNHHNHTKFLMLVRDPVERLVSQLNFIVQRYDNTMNVEQSAQEHARGDGPVEGLIGDLSYQGRALSNLLSVVPKQNILVIPTEERSMGTVDEAYEERNVCKIRPRNNDDSNNDNNDNSLLLLQRTHVMNGCPRHTSVEDAKAIMNVEGGPGYNHHNHTKFLMLVRDPVERLVSQLNFIVQRYDNSMNVEQSAQEHAGGDGPVEGLIGDLSYQGRALSNLLSVVPKQNVLVIPMESMSRDMQGVVDSVMDHVGGVRWDLNRTSSASETTYQLNNGKEGDVPYATVTNETRDALRGKFREDVLLLERLVGKRFSWSEWAYEKKEKEEEAERRSGVENDEGQREFWLVTTPKGSQ